MARIFTCGFELNSLTQGMEKFGSSNAGAIVTSPVYGGTYAYQNKPVAAAMACNFGFNASGNKTLYVRFMYYATTHPAADALVFYPTAADLTTAIMRLRGTGSGLKVMNAANTQVGSSFALSTGQWYRIEIKVFSNSSTGTIDVLVDGSSVVSVTGTNTNGSDINGCAIGSGGALTHEYYIDDMAVNDTNGSYQNSYPGEGKIICLRPDAAGDSAQFTRGGTDSGANWSQTDEITPNDATDYNVSNTTNHVDMFNCGASGVGSSATVAVVDVGYRLANIIADGAAQIRCRAIKTSGGTVENGGTVPALSSTTWRTNGISITAFNPYSLVMYVDPDGSPWTESTLNSMQIGYEMTNGGTNGIAVSTVWAMVDYVPGSAGTLKTYNGLAEASIKTFNSLANSSTKTVNGLTP